MMVEADLRLKDSTPIMAHDPGEDNNLTFVQWLNEIIKVSAFLVFKFVSYFVLHINYKKRKVSLSLATVVAMGASGPQYLGHSI